MDPTRAKLRPCRRPAMRASIRAAALPRMRSSSQSLPHDGTVEGERISHWRCSDRSHPPAAAATFSHSRYPHPFAATSPATKRSPMPRAGSSGCARRAASPSSFDGQSCLRRTCAASFIWPSSRLMLCARSSSSTSKARSSDDTATLPRCTAFASANPASLTSLACRQLAQNSATRSRGTSRNPHRPRSTALRA